MVVVVGVVLEKKEKLLWLEEKEFWFLKEVVGRECKPSVFVERSLSTMKSFSPNFVKLNIFFVIWFSHIF